MKCVGKPNGKEDSCSGKQKENWSLVHELWLNICIEIYHKYSFTQTTKQIWVFLVSEFVGFSNPVWYPFKNFRCITLNENESICL